ncbi:Serine/threonine-protein kinase ULK2 [Aphelenchoides avenae]|nr:Serine/threonine-protein kinase ULK2 [Aphelenchus avenae]
MKILYDNRVVQRDMKPANILLHDPLGRENPPATELVVKVSDYGFSRILDSNGLLRTWCGTPSYFAPEVWFHPDFSDNYYADAASYRYKAKIDLFSVGVILYECYVGKHPFLHAVGDDIRKLRKFYKEKTQEELDSVASVPSDCPAALRQLIRGLLKKDVQHRIDFGKQFDLGYLVILF